MSYQIIKVPAILRGQAVGNATIFTKGDIRIRINTPTMAISTDHAGPVGQRLLDVIHEISFTPSGRLTEVAALLGSAWSRQHGEKVLQNVSASVSGVADAGGGNCTLTFSASKTVYKGQYIWISGSSVSGYNGARLVTADSTGTTATVVMTYSATATATVTIPPCLIIHPIIQGAEAEKIRIYQNAGITSLPGLNFAASETCLGDVTVSAVYHPFRSPEDADSIVRLATWAAPTSGNLALSPEDIFTAAPRLRYEEADGDPFGSGDAGAAPWKDFRSLSGVKVANSMSLDADVTDQRGTVNWTFTGMSVNATFTPVSGTAADEITDATIQTLLLQQDDGSTDGVVRGGSMIRSGGRELRIRMSYGVDTYDFTMGEAVITGANAAYGTKAPRNGELSLAAVRTLSSGTPQALAGFEAL